MLRFASYKLLIPALFLMLFCVTDVDAAAPPVQSPPPVVNPDAIDFSITKFGDPVAAQIAVPQSGSYKITVNNQDPAAGSPCVNLSQGSNSLNLGTYTQTGFFQLKVFKNSTSVQHPVCGQGALLAADDFQVQATTTTAVTTAALAAPAPAAAAPAGAVPPPTQCTGDGLVDTGIGKIPTCDLNSFARWFLGWALGIGGGIAFILILLGGIKIMSSGGNPDNIKAGKDQLTAAISGLLFIVFSAFLLQLIGVEILHIPGFAK